MKLGVHSHRPPGSHGHPRSTLAAWRSLRSGALVTRVTCRSHAEGAHPDGPSQQKRTLGVLDALLGQNEVVATPSSPPQTCGNEEEWWAPKPQQSAPPRQTGMAPGSHGRFVMSEDLMRFGELRVGNKTSLNGQLELPKVQPVLCFVLLLVNLACYGTFANVEALQGPDAASDFLSGLWLHPLLLLQDAPDQLMHALTASCMAPGPVELVVTLWALALVAPRAESVMGHTPFLAIYLLSGVTGNLAQLITMADQPAGSPGACGAAAAVMGVLGCLAVHHAVNRDLEMQAAGWRSQQQQPTASTSAATSTSISTSGSSSGQGSDQLPTRQEASQQRLLVQAVCVVAASLGLAGMQSLIGHPSDPGGGAGMWGEVALGVGVLPQLAGLGAGMLLGLGMGPRYALTREVDIPEGSMIIPEDAVEMVVVMDRTTDWSKGITAAGYTLALLVFMMATA